MKKLILTFHIVFLFTILNAQQIEYPESPRHKVIDTFFHNYIIHDDYRWLEDVRTDRVKQWIEYQNRLTRKYTKKASIKNNSLNMIEKYGTVLSENVQKRGKYYFFYARRNNHATPGLYLQETINGHESCLVDPNFISSKDKVNIRGFSLSKDSEYLAYQFNRNGSDWCEINVVKLPSGNKLKDHLSGIKFSSIEWKGKGFFYSRYPNHGEFNETIGEEIYYHKLGDEQSQDQLIFKRKDPTIQFSYYVSSDEQFLLLREETKYHFNYFYIDYFAKQPYLRPLLMKQKSGFGLLDSHNGKLIIKNTLKNNNGSIVEIDPAHPLQWREIIPEYPYGIILSTRIKSDRIICIYQSNQHPILKIFDFQGKELYALEMPAGHSANGFYGEKDDDNLLFRISSYTIPQLSYEFNTKTFKRKSGEDVQITYNFKNHETKSVTYLSKDGIEVPMNIVYKKGIKLDGNNPTLLKAYGGFGSVTSPSFDPGLVYFLEQGGVFAYANIRGGGDLGKHWVLSGRKLHKQNSFDDFNAAAEYLIKEGYTNPKKLAATGASNGGLVVAAAAIQRPDLYAAVVPVVGVMDMIRFEQFTVGVMHHDEYGTVNDSTAFVNLLSYSPLHNIKEDVNYPCMLVMTSENDDRVPPFHSYKFVARLQNRTAQINPILLRVEKSAGHNGPINHIERYRQKADMYGFILEYLK
ncbi:S9 family peptidase [Ancylomarina euxinus]|uniref:prolyl oligopeptidase n=1 Tax=Ancylomarina euxinus TaxID=2283627 RepID=A0A425Y723_9BACT|nr:prolyl oligopeptidase family serine peptidase [Ancylomarina euxinus]MCZ4694047.1 prolyl oligopeptidase family serine peptidase [Ancylomarina euxinus]MUP14533.1 prolyl oligopeptidase family serine peptidase [Ancylomarina euxinus]RRG24082.1 S9 family peptidase [Ancylomarina euxinus]